MYVIQLNSKHPQAWTFRVRWDGYWTGWGFCERPKDALQFHTKKNAAKAMMGHPLGMNGLMNLVRLDSARKA